MTRLEILIRILIKYIRINLKEKRIVWTKKNSSKLSSYQLQFEFLLCIMFGSCFLLVVYLRQFLYRLAYRY